MAFYKFYIKELYKFCIVTTKVRLMGSHVTNTVSPYHTLVSKFL